MVSPLGGVVVPTHAELIAAQADADQARARLEVLALSVVVGYVRSVTPEAAYLLLEPGRGGRLLLGDGLDAQKRRLSRSDEPDDPGLAEAMSALSYVDDDGWWVDELTHPADAIDIVLDLDAVIRALARR